MLPRELVSRRVIKNSGSVKKFRTELQRVVGLHQIVAGHVIPSEARLYPHSIDIFRRRRQPEVGPKSSISQEWCTGSPSDHRYYITHPFNII